MAGQRAPLGPALQIECQEPLVSLLAFLVRHGMHVKADERQVRGSSTACTASANCASSIPKGVAVPAILRRLEKSAGSEGLMRTSTGCTCPSDAAIACRRATSPRLSTWKASTPRLMASRMSASSLPGPESTQGRGVEQAQARSISPPDDSSSPSTTAPAYR